MIFRIFCSAVIIIGFGYGGFVYSERFSGRLKQLTEFYDGLSQLEFNVRYMNYPVSEAMKQAGSVCGGAAKKIFTETAETLAKNYGITVENAFCTSIDKNRLELNISEEEIEILKSFSKTIGSGDRAAEISNIETAKLRIFAAGEDAKEDIRKKVKMCRSMGFLLGLFLAIVLI